MELSSQAKQQLQQHPACHTNLPSATTTMTACRSPSLPLDLEISSPRPRLTSIDNEAANKVLLLDDEVHPERQSQARASQSPRVGLNLRRRSSSPLSFCVATPLPSDEPQQQPQHQLLCYSRRGSTSRDGAGSTANVVTAPGAASTSLLSNLSDGGSSSLFLQEGRQQQQQQQQSTFDGLLCEAAKRIGEDDDDEDGEGCMSPGGNTISQTRSDESEFQSPTAASAAARLGAHLLPHHLLQPQPSTTTTTTAATCSTGSSFVVSVPATSPPCQRRDEELGEIFLANQKQPTTPKNATRAAPDASIDCGDGGGRGSSRPPTSVTPTPVATTTTTTIASAAVSASPQQHLSTFAVRTASSSIVQRGRSGEVDVPPVSRGHTSATPLSRSASMCQFGGSYSELPSFTISGGVGDASIADRSQQPPLRHSYDGGRPSSSTPSHHHNQQPSSIHPLARSYLLSPGATPLSPSAPSFSIGHSLLQQAAGGPRHSVAATVPLVNHSRDDPSTPTGGSPVRPTAATTTTAASGGTPSLQHHQLPPPPPSNGRLSQNNTPCGPTHPNSSSSTRKARHHSHQPTVSWTSDEIASSTGATSVPSPVVIIHPQQQPPASTTTTGIATRLQQEASSSSLLFPLSSLADRRRGNASDSATPHRLATLRLPGTVSIAMHEELEVAVGGGGGGAEVRTPPTTMHHHHHHHDGHSRSNSSSGRTTTTPSAHTAAELILSPSVQACKTTKEQHPLSEQRQHQLSTSCSSSVTSPHARYYNASFSSPKIYQLPAATAAAASATSGPLRGLSSAVHQPHHHQMGSSFSFSQNHSIANAALGRSVGSTSFSLPQPPPTPMLRSPLDRCGMSYQPQSHAAFDLSTSSSSSSPTMTVRVPASWHSWLNQGEGQPQGQSLPAGGETTPALRRSEQYMNERDSIATMRMMQMTQQTATQRWEVEKVECVSRWEVVSQQFGRSLRLQQRQQEQQQQRRILFRRERAGGPPPEDEPKDCRRRVDAGLALVWKLLSRLVAFLLRRCRRYLRMLE